MLVFAIAEASMRPPSALIAHDDRSLHTESKEGKRSLNKHVQFEVVREAMHVQQHH
jgi:hypothetical protein